MSYNDTSMLSFLFQHRRKEREFERKLKQLGFERKRILESPFLSDDAKQAAASEVDTRIEEAYRDKLNA